MSEQQPLPDALAISGMAESEPVAGAAPLIDPRALLAKWANDCDEWVRFIVREVIQAGKPLLESQLLMAYTLFRQEKGFEERLLEPVQPLSTDAAIDEDAPPIAIT